MSAADAVEFLTVLGKRRSGERSAPTPSVFTWFPVVGAVIGAVLGLCWWALLRGVPQLVAAVVVVAIDLAFTGMLHFDGLLDSADGLLPPLARQRRLEVMRDPRVGAFGVVVGGTVLLSRVVSLGSIVPLAWWRSTLLFVGLWAISRSVMVLGARHMAYARPGGLAHSLLGEGRRGTAPTWSAAGGVVGGAVALIAWRPLGGAVVLATALAGSVGVLLLARRRLGGFTGDVLGAAGVVGETVGLLVAAGKW